MMDFEELLTVWITCILVQNDHVHRQQLRLGEKEAETNICPTC